MNNKQELSFSQKKKKNYNFKLVYNFAPCVLNYLFLERVLFPNFRIKHYTKISLLYQVLIQQN